MTNRRSDTRKKVRQKMDATIVYSDASTQARTGTVSNVSRKGMFLKTDERLSKNAYVNMKLCTEEMLGKSLIAQGVVVRIDEEGVGIELSYVEEDIEKLIK
ncbi:MAG TPA: PilZ domain-containing protein [Deltaproteobacteria bacterium]|nr:PilZ domain-containing protein [Deltaproteobacteria bacterium]HOI06303.1 PilZ domain-containing protein [Deltaproteobacteria bacterium]